MKKIIYSLWVFALVACSGNDRAPIDREALVHRNNPRVTAVDSLASLSVGNGRFAMTVDATGLQTFPERYSLGVPLGTQSQWGWHNFANPQNYRHEETLKEYDFGRGKLEPYAVQFNEPGRPQAAADWYRVNPHRLHLGIVGLEFPGDPDPSALTDIDQQLDLWEGVIRSRFQREGHSYQVETVCHPGTDLIASRLRADVPPAIKLRFAYPTGGHCDDACDWNANDKHTTTLVSQEGQSAVLKRQLDETTYYVTLR